MDHRARPPTGTEDDLRPVLSLRARVARVLESLRLLCREVIPAVKLARHFPWWVVSVGLAVVVLALLLANRPTPSHDVVLSNSRTTATSAPTWPRSRGAMAMAAPTRAG